MGPLGASIRALRPRCGLLEPDIPPVAVRVSRYATISKALSRSAVDSRHCTEKKLSKLVLSLRSFMDEHFGRTAKPETRTKLTMFPTSIFADFSEFGPLCALLKVCFRYAAEHGLLPLNFDDASKEDDLLRLIFHAEKTLKKDHFFRVIKIFISPLIEQEESESLRATAQRHGAAVVSNSHVATHLIYPDPDGTRENQTDGQALVRVLERTDFRGETFAFLHWLHHPDSYNDWVPASEILGHVYIPRRRKEREQWHVQARWLRDLALYNDWMNELDYEMPQDFPDLAGLSPKTVELDAKGHEPRALVKIRLRMPREDEIGKQASLLGASKGVALPPHANGFADASDMRDANGDHAMIDVGDLSDEDADGYRHPNESNGSSSAPGSGTTTGQTTKISVGDGVFIPFFSKWFRIQSVHDIERRALPEFFEQRYASKNEDTYKETRNFMISTWRQGRNEYLSSTAVRRHLAGDACAVLRLHGFLEHWGLINYECSAQGAAPASFIPPPRALPLRAGHERDDSVRANAQIVLDDGSRPAIEGGKVVKYGRNDEVVGNSTSEAVLIRDSDRMGQALPIAESPAREPIEYHCDSCGVDCSVLRFHCATKADVDLCASCYQNAKYSSSMKPRDFIQMNSAGAHGGPDETEGDVWTESETLLLLEALEMYGDNWTLVSEHVGSKGNSQCVIQFLRLPIEDSFLNTTARSWWSVAPPGNGDESSPLDMLRAAGAREAALAKVNTTKSSEISLSGQPLVFGDQISTIMPFASKLVSLCPPDTVKELTRVFGVGSSRKRQRSYLDVFLKESCRRTDKNNDSGKEESLEDLVGCFTTNRVYKKMRKMIPTPASFLRTEKGDKVGRATFSLVRHGAIQSNEAIRLLLDPSPSALHQMERPDRGSAAEHVERAAPAVEKASKTKPKCDDHDISESEKPDSASDEGIEEPAALAITSLSAAAASASYMQELEEAEIDRLYSFLSEIRVQLIERRIAHLESITEYESFADGYKEKKLNEEMSRSILRRKESLLSCQY
ncbi:unnamed protein product [Chondrus crispus]|uniref:Uncharacterized protein n=1 Tax=Chondrus crispus TaxID=2769 RepID=R7Q3C6_CHOCR|nr:unnamed protein product [Chondrus crispus]CDF33047.1 unnamed protein product [Chondrus crispus]|eukprot:XP_005712850.1 unnamed protein product [Chondrus crispus]